MTFIASPPAPDDTATAELADGPTAGAGDACGVCAHAVNGHDPIALRYCKATMSNALSRHCICPPPEA